jgi:hypothetical protein
VQIPDGIAAILRPLEKAGFPYMITGSVATILYGAPRITYDVDLVLDIPARDAERFAGLFPGSDFYCPPVGIIAAELGRAVHGRFNLIHHESSFKADVYPCRDWLQKWAMERRERQDWNGLPVWVAPREYVIVMKLEYHMEGGSEKHLSDIKNLLAVQSEGLDLDWIRDQVEKRGLEPAWRRIHPL